MPQSPKFHPNERVDLVDFELVAKDYPQETVAANNSRLLSADIHRFISGFRVEIADQTVAPGQFTVYNGYALERGGLTLHNEDAVNTSRTATLVGSSTIFYIEIEYTETDTDTDSRAFWDPTVSNGGAPFPDGREFPIDVPTRVTPDWVIVTPISTTGFAVTSNPNSTRIPLARLTTDGSNEITAAVNAAATVFTTSYSSGVTSIRLHNTVMLPDSGSINLSAGTGNAETLSFSANDRANGILTLAVPTANAHTAGDVAVVVGGASLLAERLPAPVSGSDVDVRERVWQGSEFRGSVMQSSYRGAGLRDDLQVERLKDYVDFLAAQLRELKFGHPDPATVSTAPPSAFSSEPRYYDRVGSVAGARGHTVSIGNGVTTFGDFNGTDEVPFIAALAALPSTGGKVFIQPGTYTFANTVTVSKEVAFIGSGRDATTLISNVAGASALSISQVSASDICELAHLTIDSGTGADEIITFAGTGGRLHLNDCFVLDTIEVPAGVSNSVVATGTSFTATVACFGSTATTDVLQNSRFTNCVFGAPYVILGGFSNVTISNSQISTAAIAAISANSTGLLVSNSVIATVGPLVATVATFTAQDIVISNCSITGTGTTTTVPIFANLGEVTDFVFANNVVNLTYTGTSTGAPGEIFSIRDTVRGLLVKDNTFSVTAGSFVDFVSITDAANDTTFSGNKLENVARLLFVDAGAGVQHFSMSSNVLVNLAATYAVDVFHFATGTSVFDCQFTGNNIRVATTANGVNCCWIDSGIAVIEGAEFHDNVINLTGTGSMRGFYGPADLPIASTVSIQGNTFNLSGTTVVDGVRILNNNDGVVQVLGNQFTRIESSGASAVVGIYVTGGCVISANRLDNVQSNGGSVTGIQSTRGLVYGNRLRNLDADSASLTTIGIYALPDTTVLHNVVDLSTTVGQNVGIYHTGGNTFVANSNQIICGAATSYGVYALPGVGPLTGLTIIDNFITGLSRAGVAAGVEVVCLGIADVNFLINNNTIIETVFNANHRGIQIEATALSCNLVTIQGNSCVGVTPPSARSASAGCGIRVSGVQNFNITSNNVKWAGSNANGVNSIVAVSSNIGVINSNRITPNSSGSFDEILLSSTDNVLIHSNYLGDGSITGSINIGGAANVTNSDNKTL